ncbi:hypothetical protein PsorP6_017222 [Peronosclerospora sorghi]|uniref:Uncharacterized protein n=1 Tax=Peronosclerospora sorghi TaxID=230839 RepID=A0ACC0WG89_9STRA|nr:hypothetical protein PsorP6_017222 [Peronosclerospora sorghi]
MNGLAMATQGALLAPVLVPLSNCFVNLPPSFVQRFLNGQVLAATDSTILSLSWNTADGYVQRVCVGWIGGLVKNGVMRRRRILTSGICAELDSDVIEVPIEFARWVGIQSLLEKAPHSFIGVHVVETLPIARQVNVEPCTPDDWELIQLHAEQIETELLRQMCVVNEKQVTPIWINVNTIIRVKPSLPIGMAHARLSSASEIIVAPKERQSKVAKHCFSPDLYYEQSPPLLLQDVNALHNDTVDEVWVNPESFVMLDGALPLNTSFDTQKVPVVTIWSQKSTSTNENNDNIEASRKPPRCCIARLKSCRSVIRGRIALNQGICATLDLTTRECIYLRVLKSPKLPPSSVTLFIDSQQRDKNFPASTEEIQQSFLRWSSLATRSYVVSSGSVLCFELDNGQVIQAIADVSFETSEEITAEKLEGSA